MTIHLIKFTKIYHFLDIFYLSFLSALCRFSSLYFYLFDPPLSFHIFIITSYLNKESEGKRYFSLRHLSGKGPSVIDLYETPSKLILPYHFPERKQQLSSTSSGFNPSNDFFPVCCSTLLPNYGLTLKMPPARSAGPIFYRSYILFLVFPIFI